MSLRNRTAKRLFVTNVTGLLLECFFVSSLKLMFSGLFQKEEKKRVKFGGTFFPIKVVVSLVTQGLPSSFLSRLSSSSKGENHD